MTARKIVDCHVNIWDDRHVLPAFAEQTATARSGGSVGVRADADTLYRAMADVDQAIIFSLRYGDSAGIDGDDEVTAAAVAKYPDKFVGFACVDPRRADCMELLRHAVEDLGLRGVKYGPIYNGVHLNDPRMEPIYAYCVKHDLPLTMHMGTTFARNAPAELGRPIYVDDVARRHPDLKMVMAHMGHPWYEECIVVARKQPNFTARSQRSSIGRGSSITSCALRKNIASPTATRFSGAPIFRSRKSPNRSTACAA